MARPFTWKEIPALAVGQTFVVEAALTDSVKGKVAEVTRKVSGYAKRCNPRRAFDVKPAVCGVSVTRLPDPEPRAE